MLPDARLVEDLGLDSLALIELAVMALVDYELEALSEGLQQSSWEGVTVGDLYRECGTGHPRDWQIRGEPPQ